MSARVVVERLGVSFGIDRQRRPVTPAMHRLRRGCRTIWALRELSFTVEPGAGLAIVGENGAGKSTLLRALAGVLPADEGRVSVRGRIGSLLSVDGGLMPSLTGRENALLVAVLAGMSKQHAVGALETIGELSRLGEAFERPVSTYSQGQRARLGFAVIEQSDPEVLLLDEVHEALDGDSRRRLEERAAEIRWRGGIVIAAGHDHAQLRRLCDGALTMWPPEERRSRWRVSAFDERLDGAAL